jgi:hypothetical protein
MNRPTKSRWWLRGTLCTTLVLAAVTATAQPASAWTPVTSPTCDQVVFPTTRIDASGSHSDVKVVLHTTEFYAAGATFLDFARMSLAIQYVNAQFNLAGATAARVATFEVTNQPFVVGTYSDAVPTVHVGFVTDLTEPGALGETSYGPVSRAPFGPPHCTYLEAHIAFLDTNLAHWTDPDNQGWNFNTPGDTYYDALGRDSANAVYFRPAYLHELLHTFGLAHSDHSYSMMNYGAFPWANRPLSDRIGPLPDDVEALRELYPTSLVNPGVRTETAVLNTWYDTSKVSTTGAATQERLCAPSLGTAWNSDTYATHCGTDGPNGGSTSVCPGNTLRTRFAFANYSTESVDMTARLWFSLDDQWDPLVDTISSSQRTFSVGATSSALREQLWDVPAGLNPAFVGTVTYHVIIRVTGATTSGVTYGVDDWIPLRGTIVANPLSLCITQAN